ncbi:MAG: ribbon-helix-helix domain-containing protein [Candidatus Norongarragalinales archaeon]
MGKKEEKSDYAVYKIPRELDEEITKIVGKHGYRSKTEFAKDAIRRLLLEYRMAEESN